MRKDKEEKKKHQQQEHMFQLSKTSKTISIFLKAMKMKNLFLNVKYQMACVWFDGYEKSNSLQIPITLDLKTLVVLQLQNIIS